MAVDASQFDKIPKNSYLVVEKNIDNEDHIIKKRPTTGARIMADKFVNDVFSYTQKGMRGSKNSNFYEFLSLGLIPNITGSIMLVLISNALNGKFGGSDSLFAGLNGRKFGCGVALYALGKWIGNKIINKGVQAKTGVDLEMPYKKVIHELPEKQGEEGKTRVEFHRVFESVDFPRWDLLYKQGELQGDRLKYFNHIAERMGYKGEINSSDQVVQPKIRETATKAQAAKCISAYIWAALGCGIASQEPFGSFMSLKNSPEGAQKFTKLPSEIWRVLRDGTKSFMKTKMGKGLMIAAVTSSALGVFNATKNFKAEKEQKTSSVDYNSKYMEF